MRIGRAVGILIGAIAVATSAAAHDGRNESSQTHLQIPPRQWVNLTSNCLMPDNSLDNVFRVDNVATFAIPAGYSFIMTDITVEPSCDTAAFNPDGRFLVIIENPVQLGTRSFTIRGHGDSTQHYGLTTGLAYPSGQTPRPRVAPLPGGVRVVVHVQGYLVQGNATVPGQPFKPRGRADDH